MSEEKEYIVTLKKGVDHDQFNQDMIKSTGSGAIPNRTVDIANARVLSKRNTHYALTAEEAISLSTDPRVEAVEIPPNQREDLQIVRHSVQENVFDKTTSDTGAFVNWGLVRINDEINNYTGNTAPDNYNFTLDGTGVDVVIQDSGIQSFHQEWQDYDGEQRLQRINWYTEAGIVGTQPGGFYSDYDGHGSHVAGIVAGKTFGWAKNARIFSQKLNGLEGPTDPNYGIPIIDAFDVIKGWHQNKLIDPVIGYRRPSIVNMSWGYSSYFAGITGGEYRGVPWTGSTRRTDLGMIGAYNGVGYLYPARVASVDADIQEMLDAGIHITIAAGNSFQKIDVEDGIDYNNYFNSSIFGSNRYYHRGGSPFDNRAIIVGNVDSEIHPQGLEQKAASSENGPGVDVYSPGTNIMSASSNRSIYTQGSYAFGNSFWKQMNISGTSMAAPQVAGALSLFLQLNPNASVEQAKNFVKFNSKKDQLYDTDQDDDYTDSRSLNGSDNNFLFNKFNSPNQYVLNFPETSTYRISSDIDTVQEGDSVTFTLTTTFVDNGAVVPFSISGINPSSDILSGPPGIETGSSFFTVNNNTADITIILKEDITTEGRETLVITLDNGEAVAGVIIEDTSKGLPAARYLLTVDNQNPNEGDTFTVELVTENVLDNTVVDFSIYGVTTADIQSETTFLDQQSDRINGSFTVINNRSSINFTVIADRTTETAETMKFELDNRADFVNIFINDTSLTPTYSLSSSVNPVPEGDSIEITLEMTNAIQGEEVSYTITGVTSNDINGESLTGSFVIDNSLATKVFLFTPDLTTEGTETFILSIDGKNESISVNVNDTSPNRPSGFTRNIAVGNGYTLNGIDSTGSIVGTNIEVNLDYGDTVNFSVDTTGDPFYIKVEPTTGASDQVSGVTNNGAETGNVIWKPSRIGTFYYQSGNTEGTGGQIIVS